MEAPRIVIMGAGAVGGYFGGRLAEVYGDNVHFVARGAHLEKMQQHGLTIKSEGQDVTIPVSASEQVPDDPADLVLFTVKSYDTDEAIDKIKPIIDDQTQILTIQNGIENAAKLMDVFGEERVIDGFCRIGASVIEPGVIEHSMMGSICFGEADNIPTDRIELLASWFDTAGIDYRISDNVRRDIWIKFCWNCIFNMLTGIANVTVDHLMDDAATETLCYRVFEELQQVAATEGIKLTDEEGRDMIEGSKNLGAFKTSTYQDRQRGRPMEYDAFTGAVVRLADRHNIEVPVHRTLLGLLRAIDSHQKVPVNS